MNFRGLDCPPLMGLSGVAQGHCPDGAFAPWVLEFCSHPVGEGGCVLRGILGKYSFLAQCQSQEQAQFIITFLCFLLVAAGTLIQGVFAVFSCDQEKQVTSVSNI